eukprot:GFUD01023483.1.p1 GENE.GFUD01023483.1~~GFUD01023483.1.p1  ORF type:complete len:396 (-),score=68.00 GFUD01023483.1:9-1196(-)
MFRTIATVSRMTKNMKFFSMPQRPRFIYTDRYLGLIAVRAIKSEELSKLQERQNLQNLMNRIVSSADNGLLLSSDVESIGLLVGSFSDLIIYKNLLKRFIELNQDSKISMVNAAAHVNKFFQLCHLLEHPGLALEFLEDRNIKQIMLMSHSLACYSYLLLMDLLFKSNKYREVIEVFEEMDLSQFEKDSETHSILSLAMLALIRLNNPGAFAKATLFMESYLDVKNPIELLAHGKGRLTYVYAWLACKDENYQTAYEIIHTEPSAIKRTPKTNLKLFTLLKMDKTVDAILYLENGVIDNYDDSHSHQKPKICREVVQLLVKAVDESKDKEHISRLRSIFSKLDYVAEITGDSIEDLLFMPVDNVGSVQQKRTSELDALRRRYKPKSLSEQNEFHE